MSAARAALESLLRDRKLDVTLTTARSWQDEPDQVAATGMPEIDEPLGGGLCRGHLSEVIGPRSAGRTRVLCQACAAATRRGEVVAVIDPSDRFDPVSAAAAGVDLSRLLWVRGEANDAARALKAANLVLQAGGFGIVAFDLADVPPLAIRQFPPTTWMRLARIVEGSQTAVVLLGTDHVARSAGGATIAIDRTRPRAGVWVGAADRARFLRELDVRPRVIGARL